MDSTLEGLVTIGFVLLTGCGALGFILFRQPVHAALCFAVTVLAGAGLYLLQRAPFPAAATVVVYAGATIIIFLFVLMFAQRSKLQVYDEHRANPFLSSLGAAALAGILVFACSSFKTPGSVDKLNAADVAADSSKSLAEQPTVAELGRVMYTRYLWAIELAGTLLLVAAVGAIYLAKVDHVEGETSGGAAS